MAGGRGALNRETVVRKPVDLAWGWDSEAGERVVFCVHTRVSNHGCGPRCSSLTHEPQGGICKTFGWGCTGGETSPKYRISGDRDSEVIAGHPHAPRRATPSGRPNPRWTTAA
jgi:hypothetical protein